MRLHHAVHTSHLKPYYTRDRYTDLDNENNEEPLYTIDKIINSCCFPSDVKYLICWEGYSDDNDTWEPMENLSTDGIKQLLVEFYNTPGNKRKAVHPDLEALL